MNDSNSIYKPYLKNLSVVSQENRKLRYTDTNKVGFRTPNRNKNYSER